ncbi:MAG TPA: type II toxin-antitoxin system prevent-host-death family antitoxin [Tepidisphaeraceae bacterium]|nr:type II toxin-antitoxin system prevent-host-death family antitoxin [Tepidisphaeraceae bacterium]
MSEAKNKLSEVLKRASTDGPQTIRRRDEDFIVLARADYDTLVGRRPSFKAWLLDAPAIELPALPERDGSMREVEL